MPSDKTNHEAMVGNFATIGAGAGLKEAYLALKKNLEGPPHSPGLVVVDEAGKFAGVLTMDDFMVELVGCTTPPAISPAARMAGDVFQQMRAHRVSKGGRDHERQAPVGAPRRRLRSLL